MRKRNKLLLLAAVCLTALAIAFLVVRQSEPKYEGKTLAQWTRELPEPDPMKPHQAATSVEAHQIVTAIRALSTNQFPTLLQDLTYDDRPRADRILRGHRWLPMRFRYWLYDSLPEPSEARADTAILERGLQRLIWLRE